MNERIFRIAHYADQGVFYLLVVLSAVSIVLIVERYLALRKVASVSRSTQKTLATAIRGRDLEVVRAIADDESSLDGRAMAYALDHVERNGTSGLSEVFGTLTKLEKAKLERSLGFLATVGANAPYIGLFGTVLGIMKAFNDLSKAADAGQQTVMAGISSALIATAAGLMVAIPAVLAYNYFQRLVKRVLGNLESIEEMALALAKTKGGSRGQS